MSGRSFSREITALIDKFRAIDTEQTVLDATEADAVQTVLNDLNLLRQAIRQELGDTPMDAKPEIKAAIQFI